jgi:hypothetical protein
MGTKLLRGMAEKHHGAYFANRVRDAAEGESTRGLLRLLSSGCPTTNRPGLLM